MHQGPSLAQLNDESIGDYYECTVALLAFQNRFDLAMDLVFAASVMAWEDPTLRGHFIRP